MGIMSLNILQKMVKRNPNNMRLFKRAVVVQNGYKI